jgi:MFS family permease
MANMGDVFLYSYLPTHYQQIGLSLFGVGLILSVNKISRLLFNPWIAYLASRIHMKTLALGATFIAACTTTSYGWMQSIGLWILARILWGLCFASLRLTNQYFALQQEKKGLSIGISKSLVEFGAVFSLLLAISLESIPTTFAMYPMERQELFFILGTFSLLGFLFALNISHSQPQPWIPKTTKRYLPNALERISAIQSMLVDGILVLFLDNLLRSKFGLTIDTSFVYVSLILAYKRACVILLSPISGMLSDHWGASRVYHSSLWMIVLGFGFIAFHLEIIGILMVFAFSAIYTSAELAKIPSQKQILKDLSNLSTWRDLGSAMGLILGSILLNFKDPHLMITFASLTLAYVIYQSQSSNPKSHSLVDHNPKHTRQG